MIKVKCRGYEGVLSRLYADIERDICGGVQYVRYDVEIMLKPGETISLERVSEAEIELSKADGAEK